MTLNFCNVKKKQSTKSVNIQTLKKTAIIYSYKRILDNQVKVVN